MSESSCSQKRSIQCNRLHLYTMITLNVDHLSLSSCKVIFSWGKYYAQFSIVKPIALFLSFPKIAMAICVCFFLDKISCPKGFIHGTESCTEMSRIYCLNYFTVVIFLLQRKAVYQLSLYCLTNITVHTRVNSLSRDVILKNSAR